MVYNPFGKLSECNKVKNEKIAFCVNAIERAKEPILYITNYVHWGNISSRFSKNTEAFVSKFLENPEEVVIFLDSSIDNFQKNNCLKRFNSFHSIGFGQLAKLIEIMKKIEYAWNVL